MALLMMSSSVILPEGIAMLLRISQPGYEKDRAAEN
jgi:hypothetical protein